MIKSIGTWALLAAVLVRAVPTPVDTIDLELEARDLDMEVRDIELDPREFNLEDRETEFDPRDLDLEERGVEARTSRTGTADFELFSTTTSALAIKQIGVYGGLNWQGIAPVKTTSLLAGIKAYSPFTVGAYGALTKVLNNVPIITADYSGSKTKSFSLDSFYFGCTGVLTAVPTKCRVAISGYNKNNQRIAYQYFDFAPKTSVLVNGVVSNMQLAKVSSTFTGLTSLRIATAYSGLGVLGTTAIDNLKYTIYT